MPMPEAMKAKMRAITNEISLQIQDINGNHRLTNKQKVKAISELKGAPKEDMFKFLNDNFRTGPGLSEEVAKFVSKGRPLGAAKDSFMGKLGKKKK